MEEVIYKINIDAKANEEIYDVLKEDNCDMAKIHQASFLEKADLRFDNYLLKEEIKELKMQLRELKINKG